MAEEETQAQRDLRDMVLSAAQRLALEVAGYGEELDLEMARKADRLDVGGAEWHLTVAWARSTGAVQIEGHIAPQADHPNVHEMGQFMLVIGSHPSESFQFIVPAAWLRALDGASIPTTVEGER